MKHYFLVAKDVGDLTAIVCAALEERQAKPPADARPLSRPAAPPAAGARDAPGFHDRPRPRQRDATTTRSSAIRSTSSVCSGSADRSSLPIHPDATRLVTAIAEAHRRRAARRPRGQPAVPRNPDLAPHRRRSALRRMNEAGVLGRFIPDFGRVVGDDAVLMYHHYTVDEHLLRTVGVLSEIEAGRAAGTTIRWSAEIAAAPSPTARRSTSRPVPARHRQGPAGGSFDRRRGSRRAALPAPRPRRRPIPTASPGWSSSI